MTKREDLLYHYVPYCIKIKGEYLARYLDTNYYISKCGSVIYNIKRKTFSDGKRRKVLCLRVNEKPYPVLYYRIVITAWKGKHPVKSYSVDHIDRDHGNINISNLRWASKRTQVLNRSRWVCDSKPRFDIFKDGSLFDIVYGRKSLNEKYGVSQTKGREYYYNLFKDGYVINHHAVPHFEGEIFKFHKDVPKYKISNYGRIIRCNSLFQDPYVPRSGRYTSIQGRRVHRLVYEIFVGKIPDGYVIDHIDNNSVNNRVENLQAISQSENILKDIGKRLRYSVDVYDWVSGSKRTYRSCYQAESECDFPRGTVSIYLKQDKIYKNRYIFKKNKLE